MFTLKFDAIRVVTVPNLAQRWVWLCAQNWDSLREFAVIIYEFFLVLEIKEIVGVGLAGVCNLRVRSIHTRIGMQTIARCAPAFEIAW